MKRPSVLALPVLFVLSGAAFAAGPSEMFIKAGVETRYIAAGETIYHIKFDDSWANGGHGESELEFPLGNNVFTGVNFELGTLFDGDRVNKPKTKLSITYLQAIGGPKGVMRDSDWVENDAAFGEAAHDGKDLFTKSDDELVAGKMIDVNFIYNFKINEQVTIGPVLGYMFQKFKHDVVGCKGYYWTTPVTCVNKTVLDFENDNNIPYLGVNSEVFFGKGDKSSISLSLLYSGWVSASYRDIHRYPDTDVPGTDIDKYSDGDHEGNAYIARLNMDWYFAENWFLGAGGEYLVMKTDGRQKQEWYLNGAPTGVVSTIPIDSTFDTTMLSVNLRLGYAFF